MSKKPSLWQTDQFKPIYDLNFLWNVLNFTRSGSIAKRKAEKRFTNDLHSHPWIKSSNQVALLNKTDVIILPTPIKKNNNDFNLLWRLEYLIQPQGILQDKIRVFLLLETFFSELIYLVSKLSGIVFFNLSWCDTACIMYIHASAK